MCTQMLPIASQSPLVRVHSLLDHLQQEATPSPAEVAPKGSLTQLRAAPQRPTYGSVFEPN
jgi:hypothetical protein